MHELAPKDAGSSDLKIKTGIFLIRVPIGIGMARYFIGNAFDPVPGVKVDFRSKKLCTFTK